MRKNCTDHVEGNWLVETERKIEAMKESSSHVNVYQNLIVFPFDGCCWPMEWEANARVLILIAWNMITTTLISLPDCSVTAAEKTTLEHEESKAWLKDGGRWGYIWYVACLYTDDTYNEYNNNFVLFVSTCPPLSSDTNNAAFHANHCHWKYAQRKCSMGLEKYFAAQKGTSTARHFFLIFCFSIFSYLEISMVSMDKVPAAQS